MNDWGITAILNLAMSGGRALTNQTFFAGELFYYARLVGKYAFFLAKLIFSHSSTNEQKTCPKKKNWWKMRFFSLIAGRQQEAYD